MLLCTTQVGIANAYLNQPNEESGIAKEMAKQLQIPTEYPTVLISWVMGSVCLIRLGVTIGHVFFLKSKFVDKK